MIGSLKFILLSGICGQQFYFKSPGWKIAVNLSQDAVSTLIGETDGMERIIG